jgi:hypothetical protein
MLLSSAGSLLDTHRGPHLCGIICVALRNAFLPASTLGGLARLAPLFRGRDTKEGKLSKKQSAVTPVSALPEILRDRLEQLVLDEDLALAVGVSIARYRKRHRRGPTFSELFDSLSETWPETGTHGLVNSRMTYSFRHHLAVHWRRCGWIQWGRQQRSLSPGVRFREASRDHRRR